MRGDKAGVPRRGGAGGGRTSTDAVHAIHSVAISGLLVAMPPKPTDAVCTSHEAAKPVMGPQSHGPNSSASRRGLLRPESGIWQGVSQERHSEGRGRDLSPTFGGHHTPAFTLLVSESTGVDVKGVLPATLNQSSCSFLYPDGMRPTQSS